MELLLLKALAVAIAALLVSGGAITLIWRSF